MRYALTVCLLVSLAMSLSNCGSSDNFAPVIDAGAENARGQGYYTVQPGETIYFIAWRMGIAYQDLVRWNQLSYPYSLTTGMQIRVTEDSTVRNKSVMPVAVQTLKISPVMVNSPMIAWQWPSKGYVIQHYTAKTQGIDIAGQLGMPIVAASAGEVVYSGAGLSSYGNLIILKNNDEYMTAYAHNQRILVKIGQYVHKGQVIATMGSSGTNRVILHFEIRRDGKSLDPLRYLPH